ncbi:unnamed protein product [Acanthoscelides obtectus]|uniref:PiggyBac transposable element-derived protein domain-containing protein n=1 Tax=Acanthoscelides obtectus TaxID=200917 RepID=A0A9P0PSZ8_ACAOB|nr:unnamed protein product [Acanthoscelides obtectus]CAK1668354.1 hypothetical protein AOBTE_LOCUS26346 [Acanthoscelides obtectus]
MPQEKILRDIIPMVFDRANTKIIVNWLTQGCKMHVVYKPTPNTIGLSAFVFYSPDRKAITLRIHIRPMIVIINRLSYHEERIITFSLSSDLDNFPTISITCFFGKKKVPTVIPTDPHISDVSDDDFSDGKNISQTNELNDEEETNLYSTQQLGQCIDTNPSEITDFLSILLIMGVIKLPAIEDFWAASTRGPATFEVLRGSPNELDDYEVNLVVVINAWFLYRKDCNTACVTSKPLKEFRMELAKSLTNAGKQSSRGRPSISATNKTPAKIISNPILPRPDITTQKDGIGHCPTYGTKGRCSHCANGFTTIFCTKCNLRLCFTPNKNCFYLFHSN